MVKNNKKTKRNNKKNKKIKRNKKTKRNYKTKRYYNNKIYKKKQTGEFIIATGLMLQIIYDSNPFLPQFV